MSQVTNYTGPRPSSFLGTTDTSALTPYRANSYNPCPQCGENDKCVAIPQNTVTHVWCERQSSDLPSQGWGLSPSHDIWYHRRDANGLPQTDHKPRIHLIDKPLASQAVQDSILCEIARLLPLSDHHRAMLQARGYTDESIARYGFWSLPVQESDRYAIAAHLLHAHEIAGIYGMAKDNTGVFGFLLQVDGSALMEPRRNIEGLTTGYQYTPDIPTLDKKGKVTNKHKNPPRMSPKGEPHIAQPAHKTSTDIWYTEGIHKANLTADHVGCIALGAMGIGNYKAMAPVAFQLDTNKRARHIIAIDRDAWNGKDENALAHALHDMGYQVCTARWDGEAKGPDDAIQASATFTISTWQDDRAKTSDNETPQDDLEYEMTPQGILWRKGTKQQGDYTQTLISNFTATITDDIIEDDGVESQRMYSVTAQQGTKRATFQVSAKDFTAMNWIPEHLGATATIKPQQSLVNHVKYAIQTTSQPQVSHVFTHTGWRDIDGHMVYLHADGAIRGTELGMLGENRQLENDYMPNKLASQEVAPRLDIERENNDIRHFRHFRHVNYIPPSLTRLGEALVRYSLPPVEDIKAAIRASLQFAELAPDSITMPLYASIWRAPLGAVDYSVHITGQTGRGKSELAALCQQHYGRDMHAKALPASWESTDNSLEQILSSAKDTLLTIDEFKPTGAKNDIDRLHKKADRIFRSVGNGSTRQRLDSNLQQRAERRPRCLILSTGEDTPRGGSLKARCVLVDMTVSVTSGSAAKKLSACQRDANNGLYAQAMTGYIQWLLPRIQEVQRDLPNQIAKIRDSMQLDGNHARTSTNTANMLLGLDYFLAYAVESGAITAADSTQYRQRAYMAFLALAENAAQENHEERPSEIWRNAIVSAIASKSCHLTDMYGVCPGLQYGWHEVNIGEDKAYNHANGDCIGYIDIAKGDSEGDIYILPTVAYKVIDRLVGMTTTEKMLRKYLLQDGLLKTTGLDTSHNAIAIRKMIQGNQQYVLNLSNTTLWGGSNYMPKVPNVPNGTTSLALEPPNEVGKLENSNDDTCLTCLISPLASTQTEPVTPCPHCGKTLGYHWNNEGRKTAKEEKGVWACNVCYALL